MNLARPIAVLLCLPVLGALAGCGANDQPEQRSESYSAVNAQVAETEGIYLDVEEMKYQVQISKQLNAGLVLDRDYLTGLSPADARLGRDEEWFGVFLRVENEVDEAKPNAVDFEIRDTQENVYRQVRFGPDNPFAYRPAIVPAKELYPPTESTAGERTPYASLLLFKVRRFSLDNRPLELIITGREGEQAIVNLDV